MKYLIGYFLCVCIVLSYLSFTVSVATAEKRSDDYIRDRVVQLVGNKYSCTGVQIKTNKNKIYILTAAHCRVILSNDTTQAIDEQGNLTDVKLVDLNVSVDLMLLTPMNKKALIIAKTTKKHEKIHTITHGERYPSYRTDGELLEERSTIIIHVKQSEEPEQYRKCLTAQNMVLEYNPFVDICSMELTSMVSTAHVVPGSSGGPALNEAGDLIGIVSNTDGVFSGLVPILDIQEFLKDK